MQFLPNSSSVRSFANWKHATLSLSYYYLLFTLKIMRKVLHQSLALMKAEEKNYWFNFLSDRRKRFNRTSLSPLWDSHVSDMYDCTFKYESYYEVSKLLRLYDFLKNKKFSTTVCCSSEASVLLFTLEGSLRWRSFLDLTSKWLSAEEEEALSAQNARCWLAPNLCRDPVGNCSLWQNAFLTFSEATFWWRL